MEDYHVPLNLVELIIQEFSFYKKRFSPRFVGSENNLTKESLSFQRIYSREIKKSTGLRCDQTIHLKHFYTRKSYPEKLHRIKYYDKETDTYYVYLTNNFEISARGDHEERTQDQARSLRNPTNFIRVSI